MGSSSLYSDDLRKTLSQDAAQLESSPMPSPAADDTKTVVTFEPFEPGNIWTQKAPTQVQRKQWRKRVYMEQEEEEEGIAISSSNTTQHLGRASDAIDVEASGNTENDENQQPWWSKGKTAPLLSDFDSDRRSFYLAQAGIGSVLAGSSGDVTTIQEHSNHSYLGRKEVIETPLMNVLNQQASFTIVTPGKKKTWNTVWGENGQRSVTHSDKKSKSHNDNTTSSKTTATPSRSSTSSSRGARGAGGHRGKPSTRVARKTL